MEALDRLAARNATRLDPNKVLKPVEVRTVNDIQRLVAELDPNRNKPHTTVPVSALIDVPEDKAHTVYKVSADTKSKSKRDMIVEALEIIKKRLDAIAKMDVMREATEINGKTMTPASIGNGVDSTSWVDPLLSQWFGAKREGLKLRWDLADGYTYRYDVYTHKLTRSRDAS